MKKIFKYEITGGEQPVKLPRRSNIIKVSMQNGQAFLWALFDVKNIENTEDRYIRIYGTGDEIPLDREYHGTFFSGAFVWHVFEDINK